MSGYWEDVLAWSERQGALLRRIAAGEAVKERPDWDNIIEEVESVGRSELAALKSLLVQALAYMLKAEAWPLSPDVPRWQAEARGFRAYAADRFSPSMRQNIDITVLYRRALRRLPEAIDGQRPLPVPEQCSVTLDELLSED